MKARNEDTAMVKRFVRPVLVGALVGALSCLVMLLVMAAVMAAVDVPKVAVTPLAIAAGAFGAFISGLVGARIAKEKGWLFGAACGLLLFVMVLIAGFAVLKDVRGASLAAKLATMVICGAIGGIIGVNTRKR